MITSVKYSDFLLGNEGFYTCHTTFTYQIR